VYKRLESGSLEWLLLNENIFQAVSEGSIELGEKFKETLWCIPIVEIG
jgi:hypothetical protein